MKPIIEVENISKQYRLGVVGTGTLSHDLTRWWYKFRGKEDPYLKIGETNDRTTVGDSDYVWALKDINFKVNPGEVLGIVGKNGAGKSTLLKLLSRVTAPTTGEITLNGRIASLLEVGTGFHPELTGKENIFLNGAILGMSKKEIQLKFDEIVQFAGCERYIDTPVKRYSSGMYVRLAFAVAAHLEPDILIVDEVLAVGDAEFQKKAIGKMKNVSNEDGRTVLFVSHNMAAVKSLCTRGILIENGEVVFEGTAIETVDKYLNESKNNIVEKQWREGGYKVDEVLTLDKIVTYSEGCSQLEFTTDSKIMVDIEFNVKTPTRERYDFTLQIKDSKDQILFPIASATGSIVVPRAKGNYKAQCEIPKNFFNTGEFYMNLLVVKNKRKILAKFDDILGITLTPPTLDIGEYTGKVDGFLRPYFNWKNL